MLVPGNRVTSGNCQLPVYPTFDPKISGCPSFGTAIHATLDTQKVWQAPGQEETPKPRGSYDHKKLVKVEQIVGKWVFVQSVLY